MRLMTLISCLVTVTLPVVAHSASITNETFSLETSWASPGAGAFAASGSGVWVVTSDGTVVRSYDASGSQVATWSTNVPENDIFDRGIGVDGAGFVYVMTASLAAGATVRKFQADGTLVSSEPFAFPPKLGFAVNSAGTIFGGDDSFDGRIALLALGSDGTQYFSDRKSTDHSLYGSGPGASMVPRDGKCGGPRNISTSCYTATYAAATDSRLFVSGLWCNSESICENDIHVFGPGPVLIGDIPQTGMLALGSPSTAYVLTSASTIEKWTSSGSTLAPNSTWGMVKNRWH